MNQLLAILLLFLTLFSSINSQSAIQCQQLFSSAIDKQSKSSKSTLLFAENHEPKESPIQKFSQSKKLLRSEIEKLDSPKQSEAIHLIKSVEFFDYAHTAKTLWENYLTNSHNKLDFTNLYDHGGPELKGAPFNGFMRAREYLKSTQETISLDLIKKVHTLVMQDRVEGLRDEQLGVIRTGEMYGNAVGIWALKPSQIEAIIQNPYLSFEKDYRSATPTPEFSNIKIWGENGQNSLDLKSEPRTSGYIIYPYISKLKAETLELIKTSHPELYSQIMQYRDGHFLVPTSELNQKLITALSENRINRFVQDQQKMFSSKEHFNERDYINLVADFQRDLVSIHPLGNGNGRTTRLILNYLLEQAGLPPARIEDPFQDIQVSKQEWRDMVYRGVQNTASLYADIAYRLQNGLMVEHSPELLHPAVTESVAIKTVKQGSTKNIDVQTIVSIEKNQFTAFAKSMMDVYPQLKTNMQQDILSTMSYLNSLFVEYFRTKTIRYIHDKDGDRIIKLRLVEQDFIDQFAQITASDKTQWQNKIDRWYDKNMLIWRGLADRNREVQDSELIGFFQKTSSHLASNSALRNRSGGLTEAMKDDFLKYNHQLITGELLKMADDHHKSGPLYGNSYGYSTSKREVVGKAFAMGAMVIAEYGKQNDPELQKQLKSRINVASYRAWKDVDLGRLKVFDSRFSYIYGRQAEVMGIGGTDPDAVMLIQRLAADGSVTHTFIRNPKNPNEILKVSGRYVFEDGALDPSRILERFAVQH